MEDITIITAHELQQWLEHCQVQASVKSKYDSMFKTYECFHKANGAYVPNKPTGNHHHRHDERKGRPERPPKDFKKMLTSYLNKLNNTNYDRIMGKTRIIINQDNIQDAIESILNNCGVQALYIKHLVHMIQDLYKLSGCSRQIKEVLEVIYHRYMSDHAYVYKGDCEDEYTHFCQMQKHKSKVLNMTNTWFHIWETYPELLHNYAQDYIAMFIKNIHEYKDDEFHIDLFLHVIMECCSYRKDLVSKAHIDWEDLQVHIKSSKIRFAIEKIQALLLT